MNGKNAIILHGTGETPKSFWYKYVANNLWVMGYDSVWVPQLPDKDKPTVKKQVGYICDQGLIFSGTVIIAHSAGVPLALSVIESLNNRKIKQAILVAGFIEPLNGGEEGPNLILQKSYNWEKIKSNVDDIVLIHSDNDPWGCDDKQGRKMLKNLGGKLIIMHGQGHFGSNTFNQPYTQFPFLLKLVD